MTRSWTEELGRLLDEIGARVTFSVHCRSGIVGDLCRCWRCSGYTEPREDESAAARDAALIDTAKRWGVSIGLEVASMEPATATERRRPWRGHIEAVVEDTVEAATTEEGADERDQEPA